MNRSQVFRRAVLLAASLCIFGSGVALGAEEDAPYPRILVTGQGSVDLAPDMAVLALTVTREAETARVALDDNSQAMSKVLTAMKAEGIKARDLQTSGFSIQPNKTNSVSTRINSEQFQCL